MALPVIHKLKCWPKYFEPVRAGIKPFEVRYNDRRYKPGDAVLLREWNPKTGRYTGREVLKVITYMLPSGHDDPRYGLRRAYVVLGFGDEGEV